MTVPRFQEGDIPYEVYLFCKACGYAIAKDDVTAKWAGCQLCNKKLVTMRANYPPGKGIFFVPSTKAYGG